jgi:hypothetical protein
MPPRPTRIRPKAPDVLLLVGTSKGVFLVHGSGGRRRWQVSGPHAAGHTVYAVAFDQRAGWHRIWASASSMHWGAVLQHSDDFGATWTVPEEATLKFPAESGLSLKNIWQIEPGAADAPNQLYAGVEPACLFESRDNGASWSPVAGLLAHPHRPKWMPGGGGLCLHTIVRHPTSKSRMWVAISTAGVYRTDDGGRSWQPRNVGVRAEFLPDKYPEFGQCVHKIAMHSSRPDTLYLQNHWGLYRSDDGGDNWKDVANGVPSDFGFPIVADPNKPDTAYIIPLESDMFRVVPDAKLRVYRTTNGGKRWQALSKGLPQEAAYETILRDGFSADALNPTGLYFGTRNGRLYGSRDGGASWIQIAGGLPGIVCVKAYALGGGNGKPAAKKAAARKRPAARRPAARKAGGATRKAARGARGRR